MGHPCTQGGSGMDEQQRRIIRRAMLRPASFLAAALAEETDESLAAALGCPESEVWRLRVMG